MLRTSSLAGFGAGAAAGDQIDPPDSDTVLLVHSNTTDGSTTFTDASSYGHTVANTSVGNDATHSTSQQKMGTSSIHFDHRYERLQVSAHSAFDFDTGNWTVEYWQYPTASDKYYFEIYNGTSTGLNNISLFYESSTIARANLTTHTSNNNFTLPSGWDDLNVWHHHAMVRNGNDINLYIDGVASSTTYDISTNEMFPAGNPLVNIGNRGGAGNVALYQYIDEFRVSKVARYTANFTPSVEFNYA
jgi:hypothetical protein